jgi:hypothetical protein
MSILTSQLLDAFPYSRHTDAKTIQRGRMYYQDGRVFDIDKISPSKAGPG